MAKIRLAAARADLNFWVINIYSFLRTAKWETFPIILSFSAVWLPPHLDFTWIIHINQITHAHKLERGLLLIKGFLVNLLVIPQLGF